MRRTITLLVLAALALPAVAPAVENEVPVDPSILDGSAQQRLDAARATWRAFEGASHYRMRVGLGCFCTSEVRKPQPIEVRDGRPTRRPPANRHRYATVWRLFARVQEAIDRRVSGLTVSYDGHGVPRDVYIDTSRAIVDEELGIHITRFRALD